MSTVLATFSVLKDHVKWKVSQDSVVIDNLVFKLHYRATFLILLISTLLVSSRQYIGEHIRYIQNVKSVFKVLGEIYVFPNSFEVGEYGAATCLLRGAQLSLGKLSAVLEVYLFRSIVPRLMKIDVYHTLSSSCEFSALVARDSRSELVEVGTLLRVPPTPPTDKALKVALTVSPWNSVCIAGSGVAEQVINTFCFFTSTYTVTKHMNVTSVELGEIAHPGVGPASREDPIVHHAYYQWVPFVLFFQAILFYVPHYLWRSAEGGRLKVLVSGLNMASLALRETSLQTENGISIPSKQDRDDKIRQIHVSFINRIHLNRPWAYYLGLCEVLNFINVLVQIYVTDWFLGGAFLGLGQTLSDATIDGKMDPLDVVFPKVTKCIFHKYGPSGTIQKHDALCVMALNIINEKIYVFLWFWFIILAVITGVGLIWRILTMLLHSRSDAFNKVVFSMACPGRYNPWNMLTVTHECHFGDWLFLYYIAKNLDNYIFKELLEKLAEDLQQKRHAYQPVSTKEEEAMTRVT